MPSSQYGEHEFILEHFAGRVGRFLDVGAYDGWNLSNTRQLMELGWSGVCIEPSPFVFPHLAKNLLQFPLVSGVEAAIIPDTDGHSNGKIKFWAVEDALSTTDPRHKAIIERHNPAIQYKETTVKALKWLQFLTQYPEPYDFINIDVEGMNWEVLRDGPLAEMVCVEMDPADQIDRMKEHFNIFGLTNMREIGGNLLAWR